MLQLWNAIEQAASNRSAPFLIYQESNLFIRALRDHLRNDIGEILIDNEAVFNDAREFMQQVMPHNLSKLKLYTDQVPLFNRYQIETQIESAFARTVHLPSGGAVVFDHTEALLSIDINSARATKGSDIEETAHNTNMESANEIARQLRLRDLGGLIVIDFIDMTSRKHQREVEECLRSAMQIDKARVQIGRISRFGLLEMSRQRLRPSLGESSQETCPRCEGHGTIRSIESLALSILRLVEEEVMKDYTGQIIVQAPTEVINFLHNEKRSALAEVESRHRVPILMLANQHLVTPHFEILRVRKSEISDEPSYTRIEQPEAEVVANERSQANAVAVPEPAVKRMPPTRPVPERTEEKTPGLFSRLANIIFPHPKEEEKAKPAPRRQTKKKTSGQQQSRGRNQKPSGQQQNRRPTKKRSGKPAQAGGQQQQRTSKKRTSKKVQSKPAQGTSTQRSPAQKQNTQQQNPQKKQQQEQEQTAQGNKQTATATDAVNPTVQSGEPPANGNVKPEQKSGNSRSRNRRRRSPYKTGGSKTRAEQADNQADKAGEASSESKPVVQQPTESTPVKTAPAEAKHTEAQQTDATKPATDKSTEASKPVAPKSTEASKPAVPKSTDTDKIATATSEPKPKKPASDKSTTSSKVATKSKVAAKDENKSSVTSASTQASPVVTKPVETKPAETKSVESKPAKTTKRPARKKAASKKTSKKTATAVAAKPVATPAKANNAPEKDSKDIYTLKPPPSEKSAPSKPES